MDDALIIEESLDSLIGAAIRSAQAAEGNEKLPFLREAENLLLNREGGGHLIDNFLDEMLEFHTTPQPMVKCFIVSFIEKACKKDAEVLKKAVLTLTLLLLASNVAVTKKIMNVCLNIYPVVLRWAVAKKADAATETCWESFSRLKSKIMYHLDSDNEGIRTMAIKFLETLVLAQTIRTEHSEGSSREGMHLAEVPRDHRFISYRKLASEALHCMDSLIQQTALAHISSQNLLTVLSAICNIAKQRPEFMARVVEALDQLQVNLPPTLGTSQVKAVRKELKMHLIRLLKHPSSEPLTQKIASLLSDLGTSQSEIAKATPETRKKSSFKSDEPLAKRSREDFAIPSTSSAAMPLSVAAAVGEDEEDEEMERGNIQASMMSLEQEATDFTAQFIFQRLSNKIAANLALISLATLPDEMPAAFQSTYTPIATAGTEVQRRRLSRMMATQMTQADIGPGVEAVREKRKFMYMQRQSARNEGAIIPPTPALHRGVEEKKGPGGARLPPKVTISLPPPTPKTKQQFNLVKDTREMTAEERERLFRLAITRIMINERRAVQGGAGQAQQKLLVRLVCRFKEDATYFEQHLVDFILQEEGNIKKYSEAYCECLNQTMQHTWLFKDQKGRAELAHLWISEMYAQYQGFSICIASGKADGRFTKEEKLERYNRVVVYLLKGLYEREEHREQLFHKVLLEAPLLTPDALSFLKLSCIDLVFGAFGTTTLRELILTRPRQREELLALLFHLTFYEITNVRIQAIDTVKEMMEFPYLRGTVIESVKRQLEQCLQPAPPQHFITDPAQGCEWTDSLLRSSLVLPLAVITQEHSLIHTLAGVFARATTDFKLTTIRMIDSAVKSIGMTSSEVPRLVEECPRGAEALVARIVIILTERTPATADLVAKLKRLHEERKTDVRTLLPVIPGLERDDIIRILPKFVLYPSHAKSVVQAVKKILAAKNADTGEITLPPVDLLVEYHKIEAVTTEEKETLIKNVEQVLSVRAMTKEVVSAAVERIQKESEGLPPLLFHTLTVVYTKFPVLDSFLANVVEKMMKQRQWQSTPEQRQAFYEAIAQMKSVAFAAVLTELNSSEIADLLSIVSSVDLAKELREFLPALSTLQQRAIQQDVLEVLDVKELPCDIREIKRDREREREREKREKNQRDPEGREKEYRKASSRRPIAAVEG